jgi:zinc protease
VIKKIFCIILFLISGSSFAEVKELVSSYGIKFWYHRDDSAPLINISLAFKNCGAAHMESEKKAIPTLYEDTVLCGSGKYSKEEFREKLQNISVGLRCSADFDNVVFFYKYPKIVSNEAIDLFLLALTSPKFEKKEVEENKSYISYWLGTYQANPISWYKNVIAPKILFENHPYGYGFGNSEDALKLNRSDLESFHKKYIIRSNAELCIFGDVSEAEAIKLADKILASIPQGKKSPDNISDVQVKLQNFSRNLYYEGPQSYVLFSLPNILKSSEQKFAAYVLYRILGGSHFKSKIMKQLRSELGLIYGGGLREISLKHACFSVGILQTSNKNTNKAIAEIKKILNQLRETGISQEELDFAKSNIKGSFLVGLRIAEDLCYFYMNKKLQGYSLNVLEEFLQGINSVKLEQVNSIAKQLLDKNNLPIVVIGGKE